MKDSNPIKSNGNFHCPYDGCTESFRKKLRLQTHIRSWHTGLMPFSCSKCSASFACQSYLNKHLKRHENETVVRKKSPRSYHCPECPSETFRNKFQLKQHQAASHGQFPFQCDQCDKRFMYRSKLNTHRRRHRGYQCSITGCKFRTDKWTELRRHLAVEHPARPLKCSVCGKTYSSGYNLRIHEQTVHQEEDGNQMPNFRCQFPDCDRIYYRAGSLKTHIRTYHSDPKFQCQKCSKKFRHKKSLVAHQTKMEDCDDNSRCLKKKKTKKKKRKLTEAKLNKAMLRIKPLIDEKRWEEKFGHDDNEDNDQQEKIEPEHFNMETALGSNLIAEHIRTSLISL